MATTNRERVDRGLHILADGLQGFVEREMDARAGASWRTWIDHDRGRGITRRRDGSIAWEVQPLLDTMIGNWRDVFSKTLGHAERSLVGELKDVRNRWAHQDAFSYDDTHRALDSAHRLLNAVSSAAQAREIDAMRQEVMRTMFAEQRRVQERRQTTLTLQAAPKAGLKPWREVITPHPDVATGRYLVAEFAADLAQVVRGDAGPEYGDPAEFFRRTFITTGLARLLRGAAERFSGRGGDPVVELQTNFGGGKTHSMLALYHLAGADNATALSGVDQLMADTGITSIPRARRAVFVGTSWSPGEIQRRPDGTEVQTIWGDLAWQMGGAEAYGMLANSDAQGLSPGSTLLVDLLKRHVPCLILIDEWVAFVRQLYGKTGTAAGSFETNLTFAQALSEAVKAVPGALLVASLPASDIEIGGEGGKMALSMLKNTFGRVESSWRPASAEEGYEIVRRRLFEPMTERESFGARDAVVKAYGDLYRENGAAFPSECSEAAYRQLLEKAYPIHPELFERLNTDWGALDKFQRTRGVLRLMASVINVLWESGDKSLMIMPGTLPLEDVAVHAKLLDYLEQKWDAIIAADIDGPTARSLQIDRDNQNLQRYGATRRVARSIFLASAPNYAGANPGVDDRRIRLACVQPGETVGTFGDALRRLADQASYLYVDQNRYWFATQPSVTRLAADRAADLARDDVLDRLVERLRKKSPRGDFAAVHVAPDSSGEVPDEMEARLVILAPQYTHGARNADGRAVAAAEEILANRGSSQRLYKNMLVFLAADKQRLADLEEAMRSLIAWTSIADEREKLNLDAFQRRQAESKTRELEDTVAARILETWVWALVPGQPDPQNPMLDWSQIRLQGQDPLAVRISRKLVQDEALMTRMGPVRLRLVLDRYLWQATNHIGTRQLWEYLASYLYLPRLRDVTVLIDAIQAGISELVCDHFAYAGGFNKETGRYDGLKMTGGGAVVIDALSVLVKPDIAKAQQATERPPAGPGPGPGPTPGAEPGAAPGAAPGPAPEALGPELPRRFFATVEVSPDRAARDMGRIAEEVLQHLTTLPQAKPSVTIEIAAEVPGGVPDTVQRIVTENCQTLKFKTHGFERS